jgi:hypothetical protein
MPRQWKSRCRRRRSSGRAEGTAAESIGVEFSSSYPSSSDHFPRSPFSTSSNIGGVSFHPAPTGIRVVFTEGYATFFHCRDHSNLRDAVSRSTSQSALSVPASTSPHTSYSGRARPSGCIYGRRNSMSLLNGGEDMRNVGPRMWLLGYVAQTWSTNQREETHEHQ